MNNVFERYNKLKNLVTVRNQEFNTLMGVLENATTWLKAPASTKFHLCKESGLLEHSCNVAENLLKIKVVLAPQISDESCVIVSLWHAWQSAIH